MKDCIPLDYVRCNNTYLEVVKSRNAPVSNLDWGSLGLELYDRQSGVWES